MQVGRARDPLQTHIDRYRVGEKKMKLKRTDFKCASGKHEWSGFSGSLCPECGMPPRLKDGSTGSGWAGGKGNGRSTMWLRDEDSDGQ